MQLRPAAAQRLAPVILGHHHGDGELTGVGERKGEARDAQPDGYLRGTAAQMQFGALAGGAADLQFLPAHASLAAKRAAKLSPEVFFLAMQ